jgi:hypothetical protein
LTTLSNCFFGQLGVNLDKLKNSLSASLQRYYNRKGNRVVFANGMSLNQLAFEMSERLDFREVDASVLSRVLTGKRVFTQKQLSVFISILKLSVKDGILLKKVLHAQIYSKFQGRFLLEENGVGFLEMAVAGLTMAQKANERGSSALVVPLAIDMERRIRTEIMQVSDETKVRKLQAVLFGFLEQHSISILRRVEPDRVLKLVWKILLEMMQLAKSLKDVERLGLVYAKMGDALSLAGGESGNENILTRSSDFLNKSCNLIGRGNQNYPLKYALLNEAYRGNIRDFEYLSKKVFENIPISSYSDACETFNLLAKGKITIGATKGLEKSLVSGWEMLKNMSGKEEKSKIFRKIQLSRTEVQGAVSGYKFRESATLRSMISENLITSRELGYFRYFSTTREMLLKNQEKLKEDYTITLRRLPLAESEW